MKFKILFTSLLVIGTCFFVFKIVQSNYGANYNGAQKTTVPKLSNEDYYKSINLNDFNVSDIQGRSVRAVNFKNRIVIINFWASWCEPCIKEVPSLIQLGKKFPNEIVVVAISGDNDLSEVMAFLKSFPELQSQNSFVVYEQDKAKLDFFRVSKLPETFVFDKNQKYLKKISGSIEWDSKEVNDYFHSLL